MAYQRVTLTQLKDRLAERLGGEQKFWNEPEREAAINEAIGVWQLLTGDVVQTDTQVLPPETNLLQLVLDKPVLTTMRVRCDPCALGVTVAANTGTHYVGSTVTFTPTITYGLPSYSYLWDAGDTPYTGQVSGIAYYSLDETSGTRVDAIGTFDVTENSTVTGTSGKYSNAAQFDGTSYLENAAGPGLSTEFSLSMWLKVTAWESTAFTGIIGKDYNNSTDREWHVMMIPDGQIWVGAFGSDYASVGVYQPGIPPGDTDWHHLVAWVDSTGYVHQQLDGGQEYTSTTSLVGRNSGSAPFCIGWSGREQHKFTGLIDDVYIHNSLWTPAEKLSLAGQTTTATATWQYSSVGTKTITVTVTDSAGCVATGSTTVSVEASPLSATIVVTEAEAGVPGESFEYTFGATLTGETPPVSYLWDFGDAISTSTASDPIQVYQRSTWSNPQVFTVGLTVTDDLALTTSTTSDVSVTFNE